MKKNGIGLFSTNNQGSNNFYQNLLRNSSGTKKLSKHFNQMSMSDKKANDTDNLNLG